MKEVNLISLVQAFKELNPTLYNKYLEYYKISPKEEEVQDLSLLKDQLYDLSLDIKIFNNFFVDFSIPQISKQFDLLRFGENYTVNIELKRKSTEYKVFNQLTKNAYYLSFLDVESYCFTYLSEENKLYTITEDSRLVEVDFNSLIEKLENQKIRRVRNIEDLFNPSNYLVSPFNSTEKFIEEHYFLTGHQEQIKKQTQNEFAKRTASFVCICGKAGTGKTLLTFDIAKNYIANGQKVLIIHCGLLNEGHEKLRDDYSWIIIPIKDLAKVKLDDFNLLIIDETQRIRPSQLYTIIDSTKKNKGNCVFSYDQQQCLRQWEINLNIDQKIIDQCAPKKFELSNKIRSNREVASFIKALLDNTRSFPKTNRPNIELNYFDNYIDAKDFLEILKNNGWTVINYTSSTKNSLPYDKFSLPFELNAHKVIGQEFDNVVAVIDSHFYYDKNKLSTRGYSVYPYYHPTKMLFQILTRTRIKLNMVIIKNPAILDRCISILS